MMSFLERGGDDVSEKGWCNLLILNTFVVWLSRQKFLPHTNHRKDKIKPLYIMND